MARTGLDAVRGPKRPTALAAAGATVAAVVAALVIPPWLSSPGQGGPSVPQPPSPTRRPDPAGSTSWQSIRCRPTQGDTCAAPREIDHGGAGLYTVGGQQQVVVADSAASYRIQVTVRSSRRDRWVLVGAERAGSGSRLAVALGDADSVTVPSGRLSLFSLPGHGPVAVTVADVGQPRDGEVLRVQQYASH
jgi:hypothetical protein